MTAAVILAAGEARRAGGPKAVWEVRGCPSVRRAALAALGAAGVDEVVAVTGAWAEEVAAALAGLDITLAPNPDYARGQAGSLRAGLAALTPGRHRAVIFLLADQPLITSPIIDGLLRFYAESGATMAAPLVRGRRTSPAVFDLDRWGAELAALTGDAGGRSLLEAHPGESALWPAEGVPPECFWDFDTPEELARLHQPRFHSRPVSADQAVQPPPPASPGADLDPGRCPGLIIIKGAGDLATGVAHRLRRAGYRLLMTELPRPTAIRRTVAFSQAVYDGTAVVEGITARRARPDDFQEILAAGEVPVLAGPNPEWLESLPHRAFIEATLAKRNTGTGRRPGRVTLALGPGHQAGQDVDAVVETDRGHFLGRLILDGCARPDTGRPGSVGGHDLTRLIRSPAAGEVWFDAIIGRTVRAGDVLGRAGGAEIRAAIGGVLRGAIQNGLTVPENFKIGDIDPRPEAAGFIHTPSDKARAVAGGVLEGLLYFGVTP